MPAASQVTFDPYDTSFRADPYPTYARLRADAPVLLNEDGSYVVSRYDDCSMVLRDQRFSSHAPEAARMEREAVAAMPLGLLSNSMLFLDPPEHTRMRDLVMKAFTPRAVDTLTPKIAKIVDGLLDHGSDEVFDLVNDFAYPLPIAVICEMLAIPHGDRGLFRDWSRDLAGVVDIVPDLPTLVRGNEAASHLIGYFRDLLPRRRNELGDDILSSLIAAEQDGQRLSTEELLATCVQLLFAGHETTQNLIGNGMLALLRNRAQLELLRSDGSLVRGAVEEFLRYDSPAQLAGRWTTEAVELSGHLIPAGRSVIALIGSANRDGHRFDAPDELDVSRSPNPHLTFGAGVHFCVGAPLARLEGRIAIDALLSRFPNIELAGDEPTHRKTYVLRGLETLSVRLRS